MEERPLNMRETQEHLDLWQADDDLKAVMETAAGRRFIWRRVIGRAGVLGASFVAGHPDVTAFKEGARNFGVELFVEIMNKFPALFLIMQQEAIEHEQKRSKESNRDSGVRDPHD